MGFATRTRTLPSFQLLIGKRNLRGGNEFTAALLKNCQDRGFRVDAALICFEKQKRKINWSNSQIESTQELPGHKGTGHYW